VSNDYLLVVPVKFQRVSNSHVAVESAFCEHLRMLRKLLAPSFATVTVASPAMDPAQYERDRSHLGEIDESSEGIRWVELHHGRLGTATFWLKHFVPMCRRLWDLVSNSSLVHSGISHNLWRPIEFPALLIAKLQGRKTVCVVDMDLRDDAKMNFLTGRWSRKSMLLCKYLYDPLRSLQLRFAARRCSLVLLKGRELCRDFGAGRPAVKYFLDAAYSADQLISPEALEAKVRALEDPEAPLELVYFGRLTAYKGVDRCIRAVAYARAQTRAPMRLHIIGTGEEEAPLRELVAQLQLQEVVTFHGALPFGPRLFETLYSMHLLLAAPLSEDTPRSALDAFAAGIPILGFDTKYYRDLRDSGAVEVVPWPSVEQLAQGIATSAADKRRLIPLAQSAVEFARANTQEKWLRSRIDWTLDACEEGSHSAPRVSQPGRA